MPFGVGGMVIGAASFIALMFLPADFSYPIFAALLFLNGLGSGIFVAPNSTQIMNAVPARERGQASGVRATTTNVGQVLSIGLFFSLMLIGLSANLPQAMEAGLLAQHVPAAVAHHVAGLPPVSSLFAAFLGYNPMSELIPGGCAGSAAAGERRDAHGPYLLPRPDCRSVQAGPCLRLQFFRLALSGCRSGDLARRRGFRRSFGRGGAGGILQLTDWRSVSVVPPHA